MYHFGSYQLDPARFELRAGEVVPIEPKVLKLLIYLIENRDRLVSRDDLVQGIWDGRAVSDWTVSGAVKAARRAIGDSGARQNWIKTIHGQGFRFVGQVQTIRAAGTDVPSILILPLSNLSASEGRDYFADGITEDLIADVSTVAGLRVLSRNDAFAFRQQNLPPQDFARRLGARHYLSGSLRRDGKTVRINVELSKTDDTSPIWADRFDGELDNVFALQDAITARLLASLKLQLAPEIARRARPPSGNPQAYDLCLRARSEYYLYTPDHLARARDLFEAAIACDPDYAEAYAYLSYCRCACHVFSWPGADDTLDPAEALARQAVALDPHSAVAHARLGWVLAYRDRYVETVAAFERALELDATSAEVFHAYGESMNRAGVPDKAVPLIDTAFRIDTFVPPSWDFVRGHSQILLGNTDAAITRFTEVLARVPRFIPAHVQLARGYFEAGESAKARETVDIIRKFAPSYTLATARRMFPYPQPAELSRLIDALTAGGLPEMAPSAKG